MNIRKRLGVEPDQEIQKIKPGHGECCTCQTCGYSHDDCKCEDNRDVKICKYVDNLQKELDDYHDAEKYVTDPPHDEECCGCVFILRKQNEDLKLSEDEMGFQLGTLKSTLESYKRGTELDIHIMQVTTDLIEKYKAENKQLLNDIINKDKIIKSLNGNKYSMKLENIAYRGTESATIQEINQFEKELKVQKEMLSKKDAMIRVSTKRHKLDEIEIIKLNNEILLANEYLNKINKQE